MGSGYTYSLSPNYLLTHLSFNFWFRITNTTMDFKMSENKQILFLCSSFYLYSPETITISF